MSELNHSQDQLINPMNEQNAVYLFEDLLLCFLEIFRFFKDFLDVLKIFFLEIFRYLSSKTIICTI